MRSAGAGTNRTGCAGGSHGPGLPRPDAAERRQPGRALDVRPVRPPGPGCHGGRRARRRRPPRHPGRPGRAAGRDQRWGEPTLGPPRPHSAPPIHARPIHARPIHTGPIQTGRAQQLMAVTSTGRMALYLQDKHPIRAGMDYVRYAEERGFEAVWQAESRLVREATVPMAAFAAVTERIKVGSGVIPIWTRNVGLLAATFSTLDELAPGRVMLGLGAWWEPLASKVGVDRRKPLRAMREVVEATRRLLAMGAGQLRRRVRPPRRRRDRHRARRPVAEEGADLHRRDRHEDDGAGR